MIHRPLRYYYYRMLRQNSTPRQLAAGVALGVFIGMVIPYGLQISTIILAALLFRHFNRIGALLGCMVSNPLTIPFLYLAYFRIGKWLTGLRVHREIADTPDVETLWNMLSNLSVYRDTLIAMGTAAAIIGTTVAIIVYFLVKHLIIKYRKRRRMRLQEAFKKFVAKARTLAHINEKKEEP